jgi:AraC family transcriptional regulator
VNGRSAVPFADAGSGEPLDALADARIIATSAGLGWADVHVEVGRNDAWEVDDLTVLSHYLALNIESVPLVFEARVDGAFRRTVLAPGEVWFCPAGESFSHRVPTPSGFVLVTLEPAKLVRVVEDDRASLRRTYGVARPQLEHLVRALAAEAEQGGPSGTAFVDAVATALAVQLVETFGSSGGPRGATAGLGRPLLRRVLDHIDQRMGEAVLVEDLAAIAGLGAAHFSRAFKAATGVAPHQFVMRRRLDAARKALEARDPDILNVALRFGFADQAHFTRLFKRQFGVPPGKFVRERSRSSP